MLCNQFTYANLVQEVINIDCYAHTVSPVLCISKQHLLQVSLLVRKKYLHGYMGIVSQITQTIKNKVFMRNLDTSNVVLPGLEGKLHVVVRLEIAGRDFSDFSFHLRTFYNVKFLLVEIIFQIPC